MRTTTLLKNIMPSIQNVDNYVCGIFCPIVESTTLYRPVC